MVGATSQRCPPNADLRTREYLTEAEIERLIEAAKSLADDAGQVTARLAYFAE